MVKRGVAGLINLPQQIGQSFLIAQGQPKSNVHPGRSGNLAHSRLIDNDWKVPANKLAADGIGRDWLKNDGSQAECSYPEGLFLTGNL